MQPAVAGFPSAAGLPFRGYAEGIACVRVFPCIIQGGLGDGIFPSYKHFGKEPCTEGSCNLPADDGRLVVTPAPQPFPVEGDRHDGVHACEKGRDGQTRAEFPAEAPSDAGISLVFEPVAYMPVSVAFVIEEKAGDTDVGFISGDILLDIAVQPVGYRMVFPVPCICKRHVLHAVPTEKSFIRLHPPSAYGACSRKQDIRHCRRYVCQTFHSGKNMEKQRGIQWRM